MLLKYSTAICKSNGKKVVNTHQSSRIGLPNIIKPIGTVRSTKGSNKVPLATIKKGALVKPTPKQTGPSKKSKPNRK